MAPVILLCGIIFGWFTPTEAAAVIVLYAFILGFFVYRELKLSDMPGIFMDTIMTTGITMFIVAMASAFSYVLTICRIGDSLTAIAAAMPSKFLFILVVNIILFLRKAFAL